MHRKEREITIKHQIVQLNYMQTQILNANKYFSKIRF